MDQKIIVELIEKRKWGPWKKNGVWLNFACPWAKENHTNGKDTQPSFGICCDGQGWYQCFTCDAQGKLIKLFNFDEWVPSLLLESPKQEIQKDQIYPDHFLKKYKPCNDHPYLDKREVSKTVRDILQFRYDSFFHRVCAPYYNFDHQLVGMVGRSLISQPKYYVFPWNGITNGQCWFGEWLVDLGRPIILCEGLFDICRIMDVQRNCLASLGVALNRRKLGRIKHCPYIVTLFDNDQSGQRAREKVTEFFGIKKVHHLFLPTHIKDPGSASREILEELFLRLLIF